MPTNESRRARRRPLAVVSLATTLGIALSACGGGGGGGGGGSVSPGSTVPGTAAAAGSPNPGSTASGRAVFGAEEFGLSLEELASRVESTEALIGTCMSAAGFEYVPIDFASIKVVMDSGGSAPGLSDEQFVAQFGLGVTTQFDQPLISFRAGPENNAVFDGLSEADHVAYSHTLWGDTPDWNLARAVEEEDFSQTGGCTRSAAEQSFSTEELTGSYLNPADKFIAQDPRMVAAFQAWSDCMRDDGFEYDHPDAIVDDLTERLAAIAEGQDPRTLTGSALDALTELQGEELAIAAIAVACEEDHIVDVEEQVEREVFGALPS